MHGKVRALFCKKLMEIVQGVLKQTSLEIVGLSVLNNQASMKNCDRSINTCNRHTVKTEMTKNNEFAQEKQDLSDQVGYFMIFQYDVEIEMCTPRSCLTVLHHLWARLMKII